MTQTSVKSLDIISKLHDRLDDFSSASGTYTRNGLRAETMSCALKMLGMRSGIWSNVKITLADLLACKQGGTVASMLIDVRGFWAHDNRENLLQEEEEPEEE